MIRRRALKGRDKKGLSAQGSDETNESSIRAVRVNCRHVISLSFHGRFHLALSRPPPAARRPPPETHRGGSGHDEDEESLVATRIEGNILLSPQDIAKVDKVGLSFKLILKEISAKFTPMSEVMKELSREHLFIADKRIIIEYGTYQFKSDAVDRRERFLSAKTYLSHSRKDFLCSYARGQVEAFFFSFPRVHAARRRESVSRHKHRRSRRALTPPAAARGTFSRQFPEPRRILRVYNFCNGLLFGKKGRRPAARARAIAGFEF
ncbi:hypothetical protein EVAR_7260_1 [Eumeta japonica]|uniref:Uncharacterized protein n=1 Tax=Eumeta variegata TaxID=151549 RepID=A0A4C1T5B5_EUMVA|nr:hypothetical protein EVAR_7260_1 [Eumeta japonica]